MQLFRATRSCNFFRAIRSCNSSCNSFAQLLHAIKFNKFHATHMCNLFVQLFHTKSYQISKKAKFATLIWFFGHAYLYLTRRAIHCLVNTRLHENYAWNWCGIPIPFFRLILSLLWTAHDISLSNFDKLITLSED